MKKNEAFVMLAVTFIAIFCFSVIGFLSGLDSGAKNACQSVKLEWVKDKCMKVTREAV